MKVSDLPPKQLILAEWVAPMCAPILRGGGVVFEGGRVSAVGLGAQLRREHPDAVVIDVGGAILMPGLVNAHVHLDLTHATRPAYSGSFVDWVTGVIREGVAKGNDPTPWIEATAEGFAQCLRFGVTSVGDIGGRFVREVRSAFLSPPVAGERSLRPRWTSYGEVTAMGQRRGLLEARLAAAVDGGDVDGSFHVGVSPHAPYSIEPDGYRRCLEVARSRRLPLTTHLAETLDEATFLASHAGPFRELWAFLDAWDDHVPTFTGGPIRYAQSLGLLDYPSLLAHVNYCDDAELTILAAGDASVVYCPRTHRYFEHPPHRFRDMLAAGINVAVGTDSCASSPDLNLVDDLRLIHEIAPEMPVEQVWEMATVRAAAAIGAEGVGSLRPGSHADVIAFDVRTGDPLGEILEGDVTPRAVWVAGQEVPLTLP